MEYSGKITVRRALQLKSFTGYKVVAGEAGLDREVTRVTALELPDAADWVVGGEIVCTTGFYLQDISVQKSWVKSMSQKGVAALVVKPERYLMGIPEILVEAANAHSFPVIALPLDVIFAVIIEEVTGLMWEAQVAQLRNSYEIQRNLMFMIQESKEPEEMLSYLGQLSGMPILMEDRFFNTVAQYCPEGNLDNDCLAQRRTAETRAKIRNDAVLQRITSPQCGDGDRLGNIELNLAGYEIINKIIAVRSKDHLFGTLSILMPNRDYDILAGTILEHASTVLAMKLMMEVQNFYSVMDKRNNLLKLITSDNDVPAEKIYRTSGMLGLDLEQKTTILLVRADKAIAPLDAQNLEKAVQQADENAMLFTSENLITIFFHPNIHMSRRRVAGSLLEQARRIEKLLARQNHSCSIGISDVYGDLHGLRTGYKEAEQCVMKAMRMDQRIVAHADLGIEKIFSLTSSGADLEIYAEEVLQKLLEYNDPEFLSTLRVYLENKYNQTRTAKALNIHLNTLKYRISRIQDILDVDLEDTETCLTLYLALRILNNRIADLPG